MFVLISESRLKFYYFEEIEKGSKRGHLARHKKLLSEQGLASQQNFIESLLIVFYTTSIDQDNLIQKLEQVCRALITEYMTALRFLKDVKISNSNVSSLVAKDVSTILKARCHLNSKMSHMAGLFKKKYIEHNALLLGDFNVFSVFHDCITALNDQLRAEYTSLASPVVLRTIEQYVFLPSDKQRMKTILT
mmetsp:Transcript_35344/g.54103  ORF Transcript_35344/g.54103 Transcript_35344/m.54103 type:complete len:191 (+) Transcript_35344:906-1478(+)